MININTFASRHIGPRNEDIAAMLKIVNCKSLDELIKKHISVTYIDHHDLDSKIISKLKKGAKRADYVKKIIDKELSLIHI